MQNIIEKKIDPNSSKQLIQSNISLKDKNWFQTGGNAQWFAQPTTTAEFQTALNWAHKHNLSIFVLGNGANILISDNGFHGLVIQPQLITITHHLENFCAFVTAEAGVTIQHLIEYCLDNNILGLEEFSGIPGTVGGATYINLHYFEFLLSHFLVQATVIEKASGIVKTVDTAWFNFAYDDSTLIKEDCYLIDATFTLKQASDLEIAFARGRCQEIIRHRAARYPTEKTCGSFFRNFLPHELSQEKTGKKLPFIAYYLDRIGVKGSLRVGGASVSHQHANMIVNDNMATSADIIAVARQMQELVYQGFNLIAQPECRLIGFAEYPLLK